MSNESNPSVTSARGEWALARRDFLALGTAAAAGVAATRLSAGTISTILTPSAGTILSVGFAEGVKSGAPVQPASRFRQADTQFLRTGVRVTVHGAWRPERLQRDPVSIRLSAFFPHVTENGRLPFLAWSHALTERGLLNVSGGSSFRVPLDENGTLPLAVQRIDLAPGRLSRLYSLTLPPTGLQSRPNLALLEQSGSVCRLSSGDSGDLRLREGTYFIALRSSSSDRAPSWSAISVEEEQMSTPGGMLRLRGEQPVAFEYVALSVAYAKA